MTVAASSLRGSAAVRGGWICFGIGIALAALSTLLSFLYIPLLIAAFILGIVAIAQSRLGAGIAILLSALIVPAAIVTYAPGFLGALLGIRIAAGS